MKMINNETNQQKLIQFLSFVDQHTYILDGERYYNSDNERVTIEELAFMFLDGDLNR